MILMLIPIVLVAAGSFFSMEAVIEALDEVVEEVADEMHPVMQLQTMIQDSAMPLHDYLMHGSQSERELFFLKSQEVDSHFDKVLDSAFELPEELELVTAAHREWIIFRDETSELLNLSNPVGDQNAIDKMEELDVRLAKMVNFLDKNHAVIIRELNNHREHSHRVKEMVILLNAGIFIVGLGLAVAAAVLLSRAIVSPVGVLKKAAKNFGDGDLSARVNLDKEDELGSLARAFNVMAEKLACSQEALKKMATHDALTDLYNHREFYLRMKEEIERSQRYGHVFSILIVDIDNFKDINDTLGHQAGDKALQSIASILGKEARPVDVVARYGGDEFAIILPETLEVNAVNMAERIRGAIEKHSIMFNGEENHQFTVSVGVASYPEDGKSESEIVATADEALYTAKNEGRNRVCSVRSA
jgi:diguanylate cyclase (GGDEF)-like protein